MDNKKKAGRKPAKIHYLYDNLQGAMVPVDDPTIKSMQIFGLRNLADELGVSMQTVWRWKESGILTTYRMEAGIYIFNLHDVVVELTSKGVAYHKHPDPNDTRKPVITGK